MFETAVFDSGGTKQSRRGWTTLASFVLQIAGVGLLVLMPFIYTQALPSLRVSEAPPPPYAPRMAEQAMKIIDVRHERLPVSQFNEGKLVAPGHIPSKTDTTPEPVAPQIGSDPNTQSTLGFLPGNDDRRNRALDQMIAKVGPPTKPDVTTVRGNPRPSVLLEGNLVKRVDPTYPPLAKITHVEGQVVLHAVIDSEGRIVNLKANSGPPMLIAAAIEAVRQWRYRPYVLNGVPIEVETQITVNFSLR